MDDPTASEPLPESVYDDAVSPGANTVNLCECEHSIDIHEVAYPPSESQPCSECDCPNYVVAVTEGDSAAVVQFVTPEQLATQKAYEAVLADPTSVLTERVVATGKDSFKQTRAQKKRLEAQRERYAEVMGTVLDSRGFVVGGDSE